jgi:peptide/nickel transport system permease protein
MLRYFLRRLIVSIFLLWGVVTLTFAFVHLAPGDPVDLMLDPSLPEIDVEILRHRFGLDVPLHTQYFRWVTAIIQGDLGVSFRQHRPVVDVLADAIPLTLRITSLALFFQFLLGSALGIYSASKRSSRGERVGTVLSLALYSMPLFWLGLMAQILLAYHWRVFPSGGVPLTPFEWLDPLPWLRDQFRHLFLPVAVMALGGCAGIARFMRGSMLEILSEDFVRTARAKGLPERVVLLKHALRNAALPLISLLGLSLPFLLSGSVVIEAVFAWPGMGRVMLDAIGARDYPVILAATLLSGSLVIAGSFLADLAYAWVDPRLRSR